MRELKRFSGTKCFADDDMTIIIVKCSETHPLDTMLSLPVFSGSMGIITQCVKSLARLSRLDEGSIDKLKNEVKKTYLYACYHCQPMSDYKMAVTFFQNGSSENKNASEENSGVKFIHKRTLTNQAEGDEEVGDRYQVVELLPGNVALTNFHTGQMSRLIIHFLN